MGLDYAEINKALGCGVRHHPQGHPSAKMAPKSESLQEDEACEAADAGVSQYELRRGVSM